MKHILLILLVFIVTKSFCQTKIENNVKYRSVGLHKDDATFLRLKDTAQKHLPQFLAILKEHGADYENYRCVVKSDFVEGDSHEHMWSQIVGYSNGAFKAIFIDSPFTLKNMKTGDKLIIKKENVEDWAVFKNNKEIAGDFSEKYLNSKD